VVKRRCAKPEKSGPVRADRARAARFYNPRTMQGTLLAGHDARSFLRRHWQKHPLLARRALPQYENMMTREELFALSMRDDIPSRLVVRHGRRWEVAHGPFSRRTLAQLPGRGWTLLVQGVNQVLPRAQALLLEFAFIPYARLDDVMVSYAPPGGGVGPHFDSYDVFLLQIAGARRWRVSRQRDLELVAGAPLKLLRRFRAGHAWTLAPGDMLYLPPHVAHDGIAVGECLTASIGFRAPAAQELAARFLEYLQERLALHAQYRDPGLRPAVHPAQIGEDMLRQAARMLEGIEWKAFDPGITDGSNPRLQGGDYTESMLRDGGIPTSLFIEPNLDQIKAAHKVGATYVELHTGRYANAKRSKEEDEEFDALTQAAKLAYKFGLGVNAGHGLNYKNVRRMLRIAEIVEYNIGHSIVARAILVGLEQAVREMKELLQ